MQLNSLKINNRTIVNIYIVYVTFSGSNNNDPILENCLVGAVKFTKNTDIDNYKYSGYGIGFEKRGTFSFSSGEFGFNAIFFGVNMSSSVQFDDNKKKVSFW